MRLREIASQLNCLPTEGMWQAVRSRFDTCKNKVIIWCIYNYIFICFSRPTFIITKRLFAERSAHYIFYLF